ncbi:MAG: hypothetical protein ABSG62_07055 [Terracidiphilus sp.]
MNPAHEPTNRARMRRKITTKGLRIQSSTSPTGFYELSFYRCQKSPQARSEGGKHIGSAVRLLFAGQNAVVPVTTTFSEGIEARTVLFSGPFSQPATFFLRVGKDGWVQCRRGPDRSEDNLEFTEGVVH